MRTILRMQKSSVALLCLVVVVMLSFIPSTLTAAADRGDCADLDSQSEYLTGAKALQPGQHYEVRVTMTNCGSTTWQPGSYTLLWKGLFEGDDPQSICCAIQPGWGLNVSMQGDAPTTPGNYQAGFLLLHNGTIVGPYFFIGIEVRATNSTGGNGASTNTGGRQSRQDNAFKANYSDQCTYFAEERMHDATNLWMPVTGHAGQWVDQLQGTGWAIGQVPEEKSVIVMQYGNGYTYWF